MPLSIEAMLSEGIKIGICLIVLFAISIFKYMRTWFLLFCFEHEQIYLVVCFTTLCKLLMMFTFVQSIIFDIS